MTGPSTTGGEGLSHLGSQAAEGGYKILLATATLLFVPLLIFSDLLLGPFFLWAQAFSEGIPLDTLSVLTPLLFSVTMTGLQYALWQTAGEGGPRWVRRVAWGIAIADTLTDIGGLQFALTGNPEAGKHFIPIEGTDAYTTFAMVAGGFFLFFHERMLRMLLEVKQSKVNSRGEPIGVGNKYEAGVIFFSGVVLNFVDFLTKFLSVGCILALDVILTPQLVENTWPPTTKEIIWWAISFVFTVVTFLVWRWCSANGGFKAVINRAKLDPKRKQEKFLLYGFLVFLAADTLFDMTGYNKSMYNVTSPIIDEFSPSWILTMLMLIVLCGMGDILFRTLFSTLGDKARRVGAMKKMAKGKGPKAPKPGRGKKQPQPGAPPVPGFGGGRPGGLGSGMPGMVPPARTPGGTPPPPPPNVPRPPTPTPGTPSAIPPPPGVPKLPPGGGPPVPGTPPPATGAPSYPWQTQKDPE